MTEPTRTGSPQPLPHAPGEESPGPFSGRNAVVTTVILCLVTIVAFEAMALSAVMPRIAADLHAVRVYGLAFSSLLTAQLVGIVVAGVWTERHGPVPGMTAGQLLLAGGSVLCAMAPNFPLFLLGRIVAGFGGGILLVLLYVIIGRAYAESVRPRVFTLISAAWIVPALVGAPLAAWVTQAFGWRVVFWALVPPIIVTSLVITSQARARAGDLAPPATSSRDHHEHMRALRAGLLVAISAGAIQIGSTHLGHRVDAAAVATVLGLVGVVVFAPRLVPPRTWRLARGLPSVLAGRAFATASFFGALTYAPLYLVRDRHLGLGMAGLLVSVGSLGWAVGAYLQGLPRFTGRRHALVALGGAAMAGALLLLALAAALTWPIPVHIVPFLLGGTGMGLAVASQSVLALELSDEHEHGLVSSGLMLSDVLGSVVGIALTGAIFAAGHSRHATDIPAYVMIWVGCAVVAGGVVASGLRIGPEPAQDPGLSVPGRAPRVR